MRLLEIADQLTAAARTATITCVCRRVLALLLLCLVLPSAAWATWHPPTAVTDQELVAKFLPLARAAWPDSPCNGREAIWYAADAQLDAAYPGLAVGGMANAPTCEIWLRSGLKPFYLCVEVVHESGHLAGQEHSPDPRDVMYAVPSFYGPCVAATADQNMPPASDPRGAVRWQIWQDLPQRLRKGVRIDCGHLHCVARPVAARPRRYAIDLRAQTIRGPSFSLPSRRLRAGPTRSARHD